MRFNEFKEELPSVKTHTVDEIAKKHGVPAGDIRKQLTKGIKIEKEHTTSAKVAKEISLDHLAEFPDYYDRLEKVEESVIEFPTHLAKRKQLMKKLSDKASPKRAARADIPNFIDDLGDGPPDRGEGYYIVDPAMYDAPVDGTRYETYGDAEKAIPALQMKTGKRGLAVQ